MRMGLCWENTMHNVPSGRLQHILGHTSRQLHKDNVLLSFKLYDIYV